jgi:KTSC domain
MLAVERTPVESRALASIGYDSTTERLEIEFRTGRVYLYENVPRSVFEWLLRIPGKGAFVTRVLEPKYRGKEITIEPPMEAADLEALLQASLSNSKPES